MQASLIIGRMAGRSNGFHGSSPILLLKNFNQDRGLELFKAIYPQGYNNSPGPRPRSGGPLQAVAAEPVQRAANHALEIATDAVRRHGSENDVRLTEHLDPHNPPYPKH